MISLIIPYYEAPQMLEKQIETVSQYSNEYEIIVVDDCSKKYPAQRTEGIKLYKIETDIPWNREGARNLGATAALNDIIIHIDTDHVLPIKCAKQLLNTKLDLNHWYKFPRYRVGKADDTRRKDAIPDDQVYGQIKPHIDSYLCFKKLYWKVGGYNEDYSGCLGGGGPFLKCMEMIAGIPKLLPDDIYLEVYTKHIIPDASVTDLSRDKKEFRRRKKLYGTQKGKNPLRFKWHEKR